MSAEQTKRGRRPAMRDVPDPYWKINPDIVADESAAERYTDYNNDEEDDE